MPDATSSSRRISSARSWDVVPPLSGQLDDRGDMEPVGIASVAVGRQRRGLPAEQAGSQPGAEQPIVADEEMNRFQHRGHRARGVARQRRPAGGAPGSPRSSEPASSRTSRPAGKRRGVTRSRAIRWVSLPSQTRFSGAERTRSVELGIVDVDPPDARGVHRAPRATSSAAPHRAPRRWRGARGGFSSPSMERDPLPFRVPAEITGLLPDPHPIKPASPPE